MNGNVTFLTNALHANALLEACSVRLASVRFASVRLASVRFASVRLASVRFASVRLASVRTTSVRMTFVFFPHHQRHLQEADQDRAVDGGHHCGKSVEDFNCSFILLYDYATTRQQHYSHHQQWCFGSHNKGG